MKITKGKPVKADTNIEVIDSIVPDGNKYQTAIDCILSAIDLLALQSDCDEVARDSIANLSVVVLDLKSSCEECMEEIVDPIDIEEDNIVVDEVVEAI